jgi:hypothetical protein
MKIYLRYRNKQKNKNNKDKSKKKKNLQDKERSVNKLKKRNKELLDHYLHYPTTKMKLIKLRSIRFYQ